MCLLLGAAGVGKTLLVKRLQTILPRGAGPGVAVGGLGPRGAGRREERGWGARGSGAPGGAGLGHLGGRGARGGGAGAPGGAGRPGGRGWGTWGSGAPGGAGLRHLGERGARGGGAGAPGGAGRPGGRGWGTWGSGAPGGAGLGHLGERGARGGGAGTPGVARGGLRPPPPSLPGSASLTARTAELRGWEGRPGRRPPDAAHGRLPLSRGLAQTGTLWGLESGRSVC
ncbi:hypothetical protein VULLAG_LOCUS1718 [Vulpes lagopus]